MHHKITSIFIALPLLCLLILVSLFLVVPEPTLCQACRGIEGQAKPAAELAHSLELTMPQSTEEEPAAQQVSLTNTITDTLRLPSFDRLRNRADKETKERGSWRTR